VGRRLTGRGRTVICVAKTHLHDGVELEYEVTGPELGEPVLLLHGLSGSRETWDQVVDQLEQQNRVYTVDQRGHGGSSRAPDAYRVEHYGADVVDFIEVVIGQPTAVVGHSLGGLVAAYVAGERSDLVRGAFLEDPPLYMGDQALYEATIFATIFPLAQQALRDVRDRQAPLEEVEAMLAAVPAMNGEGTVADVLGPDRARRMALGWWRVDPEAFSPAMDCSLFDAFDVDRPIETPVRLVRAERDLGAAFFAEHEDPFVATHPDASVALVAGASHGIHDDHFPEFMTDLERFLSGLPRVAPRVSPPEGVNTRRA